ncbi:hypothetical protein BD809_10777 [Aquimarina intermedia]|uniref:Uncharacterized protein n=1 Tax=Aquimarina intermedia TaxID=350814 RepID=A0A5S5C2J3_9FLAO|nr:hypothetical protein BD809_10777 [Aquimarina intermedia]
MEIYYSRKSNRNKRANLPNLIQTNFEKILNYLIQFHSGPKVNSTMYKFVAFQYKGEYSLLT